MDSKETYLKGLGACIGLAACDAVGTTLEFTPPSAVVPIDDMVGGGPFHLEAGEWTDDTSLALCLAESLALTGRFDLCDQLVRFCEWSSHGHCSSNGRCFDIGNATSSGLHTFKKTGKGHSGSTSDRSSGNGSLMRLAPVPVTFWKHPELAIELSGESSRTTHGSTSCVDACRYYAALIVGAIHGASKEDLLSPMYCPPGLQEDYWLRRPLCSVVEERLASGAYKDKNPPDINGRGWVISTMEAALWAFFHTDTFKDGCLKVVNLGHDTDTTGAVYGQLAGAFYGAHNIPVGWLSKIVLRPYFSLLVEHMLALGAGLKPDGTLSFTAEEYAAKEELVDSAKALLAGEKHFNDVSQRTLGYNEPHFASPKDVQEYLPKLGYEGLDLAVAECPLRSDSLLLLSGEEATEVDPKEALLRDLEPGKCLEAVKREMGYRIWRLGRKTILKMSRPSPFH